MHQRVASMLWLGVAQVVITHLELAGRQLDHTARLDGGEQVRDLPATGGGDHQALLDPRGVHAADLLFEGDVF